LIKVVPGYWKRPEETANAFAPDGSLLTGDVGFKDKNDNYYIIDRKKDLIIASGYKIWPAEVESVVISHPSVKECAVVGVSDEYRGETVKAFVSLKQGAKVTAEEIQEHCKKLLAAYKYPRVIVFVDEIPKNLSGKILRRELRGTNIATKSKL